MIQTDKSEFVGVIKMKCPYCGEEMQLGCIQCRDGVYWSEKERVIAALNIGGGKSIKLNEKSIGGPFGGASAEAWLCEKCKKIVIEYSISVYRWDEGRGAVRRRQGQRPSGAGRAAGTSRQ